MVCELFRSYFIYDHPNTGCVYLKDPAKAGGSHPTVGSLDTKQADFLAKSDNLHEIKSFVQKIGTNPRVRNKSAVFDFCPASQFAAKRRTILRSAAAPR